nr:PAS domain S-box protein [Fortiea contorta]
MESLYTLDCQPEVVTLLSKIAANLPGMIFQFLQRSDGSQFLLYVSSGCRELYELQPEAIKADFRVLHQMVHPEDVSALAASVAMATKNLTPWRWEGRIITPSGQMKWIQGASQLERQANGDLLWEGLVMDITDRKQVEAKLRTSERRYKAILDAIPDSMFRINRDGNYLDLKDDCKNVGLAREEIIGKNMRDLLPDDVAIIGQEAIAKTLSSQDLQVCEYQLPSPLGMRDYEARLVVSGTDEVLAIVRDITERKQAEANLQSLAKKFSKAFRCSPNAITISTLGEGRYVEVNDSFVRLSGYEREEAIGRTAFELNTWVNRRDRLNLLQELQAKGFVRNWEVEFRTKFGVKITGLLSAEVIDLDGVPCILAVTNDITERKQVEAQLRLSAQRDRLLTETLARIRSSLNLDQVLQTTVSEVRQFLQADRVFIGLNHVQGGDTAIAESVDPRYPSVLVWTTDDETYLQEFKRLLTSDRIRLVTDISKITASDKLKAHYQQFHIQATLAVPIMLGDELYGALIANQCSGPRHWQSSEIDLLQQMSAQLAIAIQQSFIYQELAQLNANLEQQVEERTAQLQQKMQEIGELQRVKDVVLHTVAHDLRTAVMGNLIVLKNLLNTEGLEPENTGIPVSRSVIERMIQGNDRQLGMIDSLLEMHCCEGKGIVLRREFVSLNTFLESMLQELQPLLQQNQANLKNLLPQNLPLVLADSTGLKKVLINLFTYRWQHNPPGLNFTLKAKVADGMIRLQIQDDGAVMSKLECDRLFNLYIPDPQGPCLTGMALKMYLSRQIMQAHGGEIGVTSHRQRGLTFWFSLPTIPNEGEGRMTNNT